jgi:IPT/TIG domain
MPTITQFSPASATHGGGAFTLEVDGSNFSAAAVVNFNGVVQTTWVSATKVEAMIPASAIMNSGTVPVTVTNPGTPGGIYGGGTQPATSSPMDFTIN